MSWNVFTSLSANTSTSPATDPPTDPLCFLPSPHALFTLYLVLPELQGPNRQYGRHCGQDKCNVRLPRDSPPLAPDVIPTILVRQSKAKYISIFLSKPQLYLLEIVHSDIRDHWRIVRVWTNLDRVHKGRAREIRYNYRRFGITNHPDHRMPFQSLLSTHSLQHIAPVAPNNPCPRWAWIISLIHKTLFMKISLKLLSAAEGMQAQASR